MKERILWWLKHAAITALALVVVAWGICCCVESIVPRIVKNPGGALFVMILTSIATTWAGWILLHWYATSAHHVLARAGVVCGAVGILLGTQIPFTNADISTPMWIGSSVVLMLFLMELIAPTTPDGFAAQKKEEKRQAEAR